MATLDLDGFCLEIQTSDTEVTPMTFGAGASVAMHWDDEGYVEFSSLKLDHVPYPIPGGTPSAFERFFSARIYAALDRDYKRTPDYYHAKVAESDGLHPTHTEEHDRLLPQEMR